MMRGVAAAWSVARAVAGVVAVLAAGGDCRPARAEFVYVSPAGSGESGHSGSGGAMELYQERPTALSAVLGRLLPAGTVVRWDRRVAPSRAVELDYPDWESLLHGEGLAWSEHGGEVHLRPAGLPEERVELVAARAGVSRWRAEAGESLREVLERWSARAGAELLVLTDRRYRLAGGYAREGRFAEAVGGLTAGLSHLPAPPVAELSPDGRLLTLMHRGAVRAVAGEEAGEGGEP